MKIPNEVIPDCYNYAKQSFEGKITPNEARKKIHEELNINFGSAKDYSKLFKILMTDEGSIWSLNCFTLDYFIKNISKDYGKEQLKMTLKTFMRLIKSYEGTKVGSKKSMRAIYEKYSKTI